MVTEDQRLKIEAALAGYALPPFVVDRQITYGTDWSGDPAVFVLVTVEDNAVDRHMDALVDLSIGISGAAARAVGDVYPYVQIQTVGERDQAAVAR